jgi:predicted enzyme related to lactoylglutathione lyase/DNA gyrase inhibitor GyrI
MDQKTDITHPKPTVRVEKLEAMRVARFYAAGRQPEPLAWTALRAWAEPLGLLGDPAAHPIFGFNNPSPTTPTSEYGYEFWIRLEPELEVSDSVMTMDFTGGCYAATTHAGPPQPAVWMQFLEAVQQSGYRLRKAHELEHPRNPLAPEQELTFDLYLPIETPQTKSEGVRVRGIDFVLYPVGNLAKAAAFYREVLGLKQELYSEEWHWAEFSCGNLTLALKGDEPRAAGDPGPRLALAVEDVPTACTVLKNQGARVVSEPMDYGCCCAAEILDPDGNRLILHHRADGSVG